MPESPDEKEKILDVVSECVEEVLTELQKHGVSEEEARRALDAGARRAYHAENTLYRRAMRKLRAFVRRDLARQEELRRHLTRERIDTDTLGTE